MNERRFESRFLCADLVRVDWLEGEDECRNAAGVLRTSEGVLEDISPLGACVQVEEHIPPGTNVSISAMSDDEVRFFGNVSYCVYRDYGYFVGIHLYDETRWSPGEFEPRHLTSLAALSLEGSAATN
jgi:hypothetical protein